MKEVVGIEVLEDLTARSRCDEGFLHVKRLRARNRYADGSTSREYRVDVVDRPIPDAVAVTYQSVADGGCSNTDAVADGDGVRQVTSAVRHTPNSAVLALSP